MRHQYRYIQVVLVLFGIASVILFIQHHIELRDSNTIWTSSQVFYPANGKGKRTTKEEFNKYFILVVCYSVRFTCKNYYPYSTQWVSCVEKENLTLTEQPVYVRVQFV
jgi:hypothetical protein